MASSHRVIRGRSDIVSSDRTLDDQRCLVRVAAGDAAAFGELYDRYGRVVFGVVYRMLNDPEAAEEVAQDAFHSVWRQARSYRAERGAVRTWILVIARNAAIDWRRTKGKRVAREAELSEASGATADMRVDDDVITRLQVERMQALVDALPPEQRTALALAYWGGYSHSEIAQRTGVPLGTVKGRIRMAMIKLRQRFGEETVE